MKEIIALRKAIHKNPELSNKEFATSKRIVEFIKQYSPDEFINIGKTSIAFIFKGKSVGKTTVFRAELDALPIFEKNTIDYNSKNRGVAHSCGHDGHMAILAGFAERISKNRPQKGKVVLLFQAAEEIEEGAKKLVNNTKFQKLKPDYIFALHNIPGIEKHKILIKDASFSSAAKSITIKLFGKTSHASEPENGINPAIAIAKITQELHVLIQDKTQFSDFALITIINIQLGEIAFGTSPGYAELRLTLRAFENQDMKLMTKKVENIIDSISKDEKLKYKIQYSEIFPAIVNSVDCVSLIKHAVEENRLSYKTLEKPFKWGEDFGYYCEKYKCGFFGLGSGVKQPALHKPEYNFPDDIIETGIKVFNSIYKRINF